MAYLKTTCGRVGHIQGSLYVWSPQQHVILTDITTGEEFHAYATDLIPLSDIELEAIKRSQEMLNEQKLRDRIKMHAVFIRRPEHDGVFHEPLVSMPSHGYLVCNSCESKLTESLKLQCTECKWPICVCGACRCGAIIKLHPEYIKGPWKSGITLDVHTLDSHCIGDNELGLRIFETRRSELGELLYQFKYQSNQEALIPILSLALNHLLKANRRFDLVIPVPPTNPSRTVTKQIADGLAAGLASSTSTNAIVKTRSTDELKSVDDPDRRKLLLAGAFAADSHQMSGKTILLVDDIYRSGATLEAVSQVAYDQGGASAVYVFAVTRTRVNR